MFYLLLIYVALGSSTLLASSIDTQETQDSVAVDSTKIANSEVADSPQTEEIPSDKLPDSVVIPKEVVIESASGEPHLGDKKLDSKSAHALSNLRSPRSMMKFLIQCFRTLDYEPGTYALDFSALPELDATEKEEYVYNFISIIRRLDNLNIAQLPDKLNDNVYELWPDPDYDAIVLVRHDDGTWRVSPETVASIPAFYNAIKTKIPVMGRPAWVDNLPSWFFYRIGDFMVINFIVVFVFVILGYAAKRIFPILASYFIQYMMHNRGKVKYTETLKRALKPFAYFIMYYIWALSLYYIPVTPYLLKVVLFILKPLCVLQLGVTFIRLVDVFRIWLSDKWINSSNKVKHALVDLIAGVGKFLVIALGCVIIIQQFGFSPIGVISGMGIGGIAVALAAQQTIANFFGSLTILMDQPFTVGDYIIADSIEGKVESVGLRSTRIRTPADSRVFVPNSMLSASTIDNLGQRSSRRFKTTIGLQYDTPVPLFRAFCAGIRKLIVNNPKSRKDDIRVYVNNFSHSSIDIELICFFVVPDLHEENKEREHLILDIIALSKEIGVSFAFPTSTNYMIPAKETTYPTAERLESLEQAYTFGETAAATVLTRNINN
ncbi:MAG: mechanosensitive ion channel family protein [Thermoguttaceae bacterium]